VRREPRHLDITLIAGGCALGDYDGPAIDTATSHMKTRYFDVICVLDKYTLATRTLAEEAKPQDIEVWGEGADALGAFLCLIEGMLDHSP